MKMLRALELYCGIGGMHYAINRSKYGDHINVVAAIDISPIASAVYKHNFTETNYLEKNLEGLSIKKLNQLDFDVLVMSPPCQPFTRVGLKKDIKDPRAKYSDKRFIVLFIHNCVNI